MKRTVVKKHLYLLAIVAILLFGFFLRIWQVGQLDLWRDEAFTVLLARKNIFDIIEITIRDTNAPLFQLLLHSWLKTFGISEISCRFPSVIYSTAALFYIYLFARKRFTKLDTAAILTLCAVNIVQIYYAREARAYALLTLLILGSFYHFASLVEQFQIKHAILYIILTSLSFYSHNLAIFFIIPEVVYISVLALRQLKNKNFTSFSTESKKFIRNWIVIFGLLFTLISPWLWVFISQSRKVQEDFWLTFDPKITPYQTLSTLATGTRLFSFQQFSSAETCLNIATISLLIIGTIRELIWRKKKEIVISYFFWFPFLTLYIVSFKRPILSARYLSFLTPFMLIIVYKGILVLFRTTAWKIIATILLIICTLKIYFGIYIPDSSSKPHYREMVQYIESNTKPNDKVLHTNALSLFSYEFYSTGKLKSTILDPDDKTPFYTGKALMTEEDFTRDISDLSKFDRLWIVELSQTTDREEYLSEFNLNQEKVFEEKLYLQLWEKKQNSLNFI